MKDEKIQWETMTADERLEQLLKWHREIQRGLRGFDSFTQRLLIEKGEKIAVLEKWIAVLEKALDNLAVFLSVHGISVTDVVAKARENL